MSDEHPGVTIVTDDGPCDLTPEDLALLCGVRVADLNLAITVDGEPDEHGHLHAELPAGWLAAANATANRIAEHYGARSMAQVIEWLRAEHDVESETT